MTDRHPICEAIKTARQDASVSQTQLADTLGLAQTQVARWETVRVPSVDDIVTIEDALELPRGFILRAAGYVDDDAATVEEAIAMDKGLSKMARQAVLGAYRSVVRR